MPERKPTTAPTVTIETVTPELATEWLGHNVHNRNVRGLLVAKFAEDMAYGAWELNGDAIRFNGGGELVDGQHRLLACVESGVAFPTVVIRGLAASVMPTIDQGAKRTLADVLKLRGEVDTLNLAAAVALGCRWDRGEVARTTQPSTIACLDWLQQNPAIREEVHDAQPLRHAPLYVPVRVTAAFALRARELDADGTELFLEQLRTGADLHERDPIYALRRWLFRADDRKTLVLPHQHLALLIKAFNYSTAGVEVDQLRYSSKEKFPVLGGTETAQARYHRKRRRAAR